MNLRIAIVKWKQETMCKNIIFYTEQQRSIINKILEERKRQDEKWGKQNHFPLLGNSREKHH